MTGALITETSVIMGKIEMDQSYQERNLSNESGVFSNESGNSKENTADNSSWEFWENEIADPTAFDPPILQSTNLFENKNMVPCSFSSIDELSVSNKGKNKDCKIKNANIHIGIYNSTKISDKSNLIFGFLGESQTRIYSQVNGYKGIAMNLAETSSVDTEFVAKHQESDVSILGSELANEERKYPFAISNEFNVEIAIKVS